MNAPPPTTVRTLLILSLLMAFGPLSTDLYLPALPTLARELHAGPDRMALTLSSYLGGFCAGQLLWGPIGDRYGRRLPVAAGLALFILGSAGCGASNSATALIGWRVVQAVGASAGPVLARAMVRDLYEKERSAQMLSTLMTVMAIAPLAAPILGGQILIFSSWRAIFGALCALGLIALAALLALPETLAPARRQREPLIAAARDYLTLARDPRLLLYAATGAFFYAGIFAYIAASPFAYIDYFHVPPQMYGFVFAAPILGIMAVNFANARWVRQVGSDRLVRIGTAAAALSGLAAAGETLAGVGGLLGLAAAMVVYGASSGFIVANTVAGALHAFPHRAGAASALVGSLHFGAGVASAALVGALADGTPWPMAAIVACGGLGSFVCARFVAPAAKPAEALKATL